MTRMIPQNPHELVTTSERDIFQIIEQAEGLEEFYCLHSVGLARHRYKAYAEADFVLVGPSGVFCLEVKGGHVLRRNGVWEIGWPGKSYTSREGPFRQAQSAMYPLMDELKRRLSEDFKQRIMYGWGVVFTDASCPETDDPEWDKHVVCDLHQKAHFAAYIDRLSEYTRTREATAGRSYPDRISATDIRTIVRVLRPDYDLVPRVRDLVAESKRELVALSSSQYSVLEYALDSRNERILCPGPAGTGKTMLALEATRRLAQSGQSVLLLCFNRVLAEHLRQEVTSSDGDIQIWSLHQYMRSVILEAGLSERLREAESSEHNARALLHDTYPDLFETAMLELADSPTPMTFDTLIVDEAQDILFSPTIDAVGLVLKDGFRNGRWLFFYDPDLQSELYGRMDQHVLQQFQSYNPATLPLRENFRNPAGIVNEVCALTGMPKPICRRALDAQVEYRSYKDERDQATKLRALLVELIAENISPAEITVLSARTQSESCVELSPPDIGKSIQFLDADTPTLQHNGVCITAASVSAFKGMENEIIIITDLPVPTPDDDWARSVAYVAFTRARTKAYALVSSQFLDARFTPARTMETETNAD